MGQVMIRIMPFAVDREVTSSLAEGSASNDHSKEAGPILPADSANKKTVHHLQPSELQVSDLRSMVRSALEVASLYPQVVWVSQQAAWEIQVPSVLEAAVVAAVVVEVVVVLVLEVVLAALVWEVATVVKVEVA